MIKSLLLIILLIVVSQHQSITAFSLLPVRTTKNLLTDYSFLFFTDTAVHSHAQVAITFPF